MSYGVFLSHSVGERPLAERIRAHLGAIDIRVYLFERDSQPGRSVADKTQAAIRTSDAVVVLLTEAGAASHYVNQEIGYALGQRKAVIPLVGPQVDAGDLAMLNGVEYLRLDAHDAQAAMMQLLGSLHHRRELKQRQDLVLVLAVIALLVLLYLEAPGASVKG